MPQYAISISEGHCYTNIAHTMNVIYIQFHIVYIIYIRLQKICQQQHCKNIATYFCILTGDLLKTIFYITENNFKPFLKTLKLKTIFQKWNYSFPQIINRKLFSRNETVFSSYYQDKTIFQKWNYFFFKLSTENYFLKMKLFVSQIVNWKLFPKNKFLNLSKNKIIINRKQFSKNKTIFSSNGQ